MVLFITCISIILSVILEIFLSYLLGIPFTWRSILFSVVIPLLVAPAVAWGFIKFFYKIKRLEDKIRHMATYDELSTLLTRSAFIWEAEQLYAKHLDTDILTTVVYIDLDNFKYINDTYGHAAGDRSITYAGKAIRKIFSSEIRIGRIGGDEIALVCYGEPLSQTIELLEKFNHILSVYQVDIEGSNMTLSASIGIFTAESKAVSHLSFDHILAEADKALYQAKHQGKNCIVVHHKEKV